MARLTESRISHLIRPEDLNHHGTLFAGRMSEWLVEGCFIAASRLLGKPEDIVCARIHNMSFLKPANRGDILELKTRVVLTGKTSFTVYGSASLNEEIELAVTGMATFVSVDKQGKPYAHGIALDSKYIDENRELHEAAIQVRKQESKR